MRKTITTVKNIKRGNFNNFHYFAALSISWEIGSNSWTEDSNHFPFPTNPASVFIFLHFSNNTFSPSLYSYVSWIRVWYSAISFPYLFPIIVQLSQFELLAVESSARDSESGGDTAGSWSAVWQGSEDVFRQKLSDGCPLLRSPLIPPKSLRKIRFHTY